MKTVIRLLLCSSLFLLMTACLMFSDTPTATQTQSVPTESSPATQAPPATAAPTQTPEPTATPLPPTATPTPEPSLTPTPVGWGSLSIINSYVFRDNWGDYQIVGMIYNGTEKDVSDIEISAVATGTSGKSVLQDYGTLVDVKVTEPLLDIIPAGTYAPFAVVAQGGKPDQYSLEITSKENVDFEPVNLLVEHTRLLQDDAGNFFLSGELVNPTNEHVLVDDLALAVLDDNGEVRGAESAFFYASELFPAGDPRGLDRAPFYVQVYGPYSTFKTMGVYPLARAGSYEYNTDYEVTLVYSYVDDVMEMPHYIGQVTNNSEKISSPRLLISLFDEDGNVLLAYKEAAAPFMEPGKSANFDLSNYTAFTMIPDLAEEVKDVRVQIDPGDIYSYAKLVPLKVNSINLTREGNSWQEEKNIWHFSGTITNTTDKPIYSGDVFVEIYDADKKLVGFSTAYAGAASKVAVGGVISYDIYVNIDPALDSKTLTYKVYAQRTD